MKPKRLHVWERDPLGRIDLFALEFEHHNGPRCVVCGEALCKHCYPDWKNYECEGP